VSDARQGRPKLWSTATADTVPARECPFSSEAPAPTGSVDVFERCALAGAKRRSGFCHLPKELRVVLQAIVNPLVLRRSWRNNTM